MKTDETRQASKESSATGLCERSCDPSDVGMRLDALDAIGPRFEAWTDANLHAVVVRRQGRLVFERYFAGEDECRGQPLGRVIHHAATKHDVRSITKSIVSLLVGIAIDRDWIQSVDRPVLAAFPEFDDLRTSPVGSVTLRHLLTMSAGLDWNEAIPYTDPANSEQQMVNASDRCRYALERARVAAPGTNFGYNGGLSTLLAEVVQRAAGRPLDAIAAETLFGPLGITDVNWLSYADGTPNAASGLRVRAPDLAKIGQLVLDEGAWGGRQIVSRRWIRESTAAHIGADGLFFYGFHWWLGRSLVARREIKWIAALGYGGQRLVVIPSMGIVVVVFAGLYANPALALKVSDVILREHVLAAATD